MSYIVSTSILGIQTFVTRFDPSGVVCHRSLLSAVVWWCCGSRFGLGAVRKVFVILNLFEFCFVSVEGII